MSSNKELKLHQPQVLFKKPPPQLLLPLLRAKPLPLLRNSKHLNKKHSLTSLPRKRSKDKLKLSKTKSSRRRLLMLRRRDKTKKFFPSRELKSLRDSKRKKLPKSSKLRRWSKNSCQLKLFKKPKLLLLRRPPLRQTLLD